MSKRASNFGLLLLEYGSIQKLSGHPDIYKSWATIVAIRNAMNIPHIDFACELFYLSRLSEHEHKIVTSPEAPFYPRRCHTSFTPTIIRSIVAVFVLVAKMD